MAIKHSLVPPRPTVEYVIGPDGRRMTLADLPSPNTKRWVIARKAAVVAAVRGGLLRLEDACSRYALSSDEILSWQDSIDHFGLAGLRTTQIQRYRRRRPKRIGHGRRAEDWHASLICSFG